MEFKDLDDNYNTDTEEETLALMSKRARRVSFAETTAVHYFDRDEESDKNPSTTEASEEENWLRRTESDEIRGLLLDDGGSAAEEFEEDDAEVPVTARKSFFRPIDSPSPASSNFGSATSNDEENFFGPIPAEFIKRGLSNSAGDDENHEITMDSTTFSMHFRSLAKSESGGEFKTPTDFRYTFGEGTQTQTATNPGNSMVLTGVKSPIVPLSSSVERAPGSCNSTDMSLVKDNLDGFDYGQLSPGLDALLAEGPGLDALLAEGQKDVAASSSTQLERLISIDYPQEDSKCDGVKQNGTPLPKIPTRLDSPSNAHEERTNMPYAQSPADQPMKDILSYEECSPGSGKLNIGRSPIQMKDVSTSQEFVRNAEKIRKRKAEFDQLGTISDLNSENQVGSFLTGSISSLNAKRRQIFKVKTCSSDHHQNSAFLQKQPESFHSKGSDRIICSLPPLPGKSISRLKWLKDSPFASPHDDGVEHSKVTLSGNLSKSISKNSISAGIVSTPQFRYVDAPVACLEEQFSSASRDSEKKHMNVSDVHMLDQAVGTRQRLRVGDVSEDDRPTILASDSTSSKEGIVAGASPFHISTLGKQDNDHVLLTVNVEEVNLISSGSDSPLLDNHKYVKPATSETPNKSYTSNLSKGRHSIATPNTTVRSSSVTEEELVTSECIEYQQSHLETPKQPFDFTLHEESIANVKEPDNSILETKDPHFTMSESGLASKLIDASETGINCQTPILKNLQLNGPIPVRHGLSEQHHFSSSNKSIRMGSRITMVGEELPAMSKNYHQEQYLHSFKEEQCTSAHESEVLEVRRTDDLILESHQIKNASNNSQNAFDICDEDYSFKMKNLSGKLGADMEEAVDILQKHQHFLNDNNQTVEFHSGCLNEISEVTHNTDGDKRQQNLTDIFKNFKLLMEKWFSSSVVQLDMHLFENLEGIMGTLQKFAVRNIEMSEEFDHAQLKRTAETKILMYKALYGKVKLKLKHLMKKRLLNQIELLQSAVQESKLLKSKCCCELQSSRQQNNVDGGCNSQSYTTDQDKNKDMGESVSVLTKALEDSQRKMENLTSSFHTSLKIPGEPNCNKTIAIAVNHLKSKAACRFLQQEIQLWEVDSAENNGQLDVVLNYDGIISQRFKLKHKPKSSISISSELINSRISKTWPKMSASAAFEFALSGNTTLKYTGPVIFARETQRISSLLTNLCEVLEEIKRAQIELGNMPNSSFQSPSAGRLVLHLMFINYNNGSRVVLSFDMSCLSCGVYPSDIIPYEVGDASNGNRKLIPQSLLDEIKSSIGGLRSGYTRVLRLCRCVSNILIQTR